MKRLSICIVLFSFIAGLEYTHHSAGSPAWIYHCWDYAENQNHIRDPFCPLQTCWAPPRIANGDLAPPYGYNTSLANSSVIYVCNKGYAMFGDAKVICALVPDSYPPVYGWTKTPECRNIVHCGDAPEVAYGRHKDEYSREIGSIVAYICDNVHVLDGNETIECVANEDRTSASWTTPPQCVVVCNQPPSITNGTMVALSGTREGDIASYECDASFILFGSQNITCLNTSKWSDAPHCTNECGDAPEIANGHHKESYSREINSTLAYICDPGHILDGNEIITCNVDVNKNSASWTTPPQCVVDCSQPPSITNGTVNALSGTFEGDIASYVCDAGFKLFGSENITCLNTSKWSEAPNCTSVCNNPPSIADGTISSLTGLFVGDSATYACNNNYKMIGLENSTCLPSLEWSISPSCVKDCGVIREIDNGKHQLVNFCNDSSCNVTDVMTVKYVCNEKFEMRGNPIVTCDNVGSHFAWSVLPYCICIRKPIDLVFVIDSSGSVGIEGFNDTKDFLINLIRVFHEDRTRFGLMFFADTANIVFNLKDYVGDTDAMIAAILSVIYEGGGTKTYDGLQMARETMFTSANGMRDNSSHILILLSDGQSDDVNRTIAQADLLKNSGVTIYTVGVGDFANILELGPVASPRAGTFNETYYFTVDNYANIDQVSGPLADATCAV
ncbi:sushi, von Willebrand factor type A, EGF and pentraxin domain-containing protein 1-like [Mya arenaria]|uniref:sushi, von Willebrand factor type A, EGF and pentraxin domain-containing protein 1-like n=1 Tax=Mya arenaria TaxID=6604 RepID=UPI0022E49EA3|nr:sushi, von Willebrand factor type A, EGF and pentraxin domain-containing protein 1-like [Mya arenaria]